MRLTLLLVTGLMLTASASAQTTSTAKKAGAAPSPMAAVVPLGTEKWGDLPPAAMVGTPAVEMGGKLQIAIVQGNPMQAGQPYTVRLLCSDGTKIAPHWHPTAENVTVIKGTFSLGMGSKWDTSTMKDLPTGSFASAPARMRHYAMCKGEGIVQVHGMGPLVINFVQPETAQSGN